MGRERVWPDPNCMNCQGRGCMSCVFREWEHTCVDDCPFCCPGHWYVCPICSDETPFAWLTRVDEDPRRCEIDGALLVYVEPRWLDWPAHSQR